MMSKTNIPLFLNRNTFLRLLFLFILMHLFTPIYFFIYTFKTHNILIIYSLK